MQESNDMCRHSHTICWLCWAAVKIPFCHSKDNYLISSLRSKWSAMAARSAGYHTSSYLIYTIRRWLLSNNGRQLDGLKALHTSSKCSSADNASVAVTCRCSVHMRKRGRQIKIQISTCRRSGPPSLNASLKSFSGLLGRYHSLPGRPAATSTHGLPHHV